MKKTVVTAFALLSIFNFSLRAEENPEILKDTTSVRHLNLAEVKVNASKVNAKMKDLPQKVEVITKRVIEASPANDVAGLLKTNGVVDIQQYPGVNAGIGIRGFAASTSSKYAVILINGKPSGTENIASIDLSNVERVEILKGPFSSQYGSDAMGGVVNIVTKESAGKISGRVSAEYGSFQTSKFNLNIGGAASEVVDFDFSYSFHNQGKDYKVGDNNLFDKSYAKSILDATTYGERMENSKLRKHNMSTRIGVKLSKDWKVNLNGSYFTGESIETPGSFWHIYGMNSKDLERYSGGIDVMGKIGNHKLTISPFYSEQDDRNFDVGNDEYGDTKYVFKNYGFQLNDVYQLGDHTIAIGVDNNTQKYESYNYTTTGALEAPFQPDYNNIATGVFSQLQFKLLDGDLVLSAGGRGDHIKFETKANEFLNNKASSEEYWVFTKNIGAKYNLPLGLSVHASWGDAFLAPTAFQVAGVYENAFGNKTLGNDDLNAEKSKTWDFGFGYKDFTRGINFDITYFDTHHKDKIIQKDLENFDRTFINANKANMNGLEVMASYDFGALKDYEYSLRVYLNYTHIFDATQKVKQDDGSFLKSNMKYVRDNNASFGIEFDNLKGFSTRLHGRYIGHRYEGNYMYAADYSTWPETRTPINFNGQEVRKELINEDVLRHPVYYIFDYTANYAFNEKYSLGVKVANLFDENYSEKDGFNMPGRSIMVNFTYRF